MRKISMIIFAALVVAVIGFAFQAEAAQPRFQNFAIVVDQSADMHKNYDGQSKHLTARGLARDFIKEVPTDIPLQGAIYMYGIMAAENKNKILDIQKLSPFNATQFRKATKEMDSQSGPSSLSVALEQVRRDFKDVPGRTVVLVISGGNFTDVGEPATEAERIKEQYGNRMCIWTVMIGKSSRGGENLDGIARKTACGESFSSSSIDGGSEMRRFVALMFFGVENDNDADGVNNQQDKCPNTPYGASVDGRGCWVVDNIQFESGKAEIKSEYNSQLDEIASVMNSRPNLKVLIEGHTDSQGDADYNQNLSNQRANAVMNYLINAGVDPFRLRAVGKGESEPVATNDTAEGRAKNRRIEFVIQK